MLDSNDHRNIGARLDLFHFQEEAPGMAFWHPRGFVVYRQLEDAVRRQLRRDGFSEVRTPQILREPVWNASGHASNFVEGMYWLNDGDARAAVKPVNCPGQIQIFARRPVSHRELPLRLAELGIVHRSEPSGTLHGLFRLRQFTQDDGHIFCEEKHIDEEVRRFSDSLKEFYAAFGFHVEAVALSTRPEKRAGHDRMWDRAEHLLAAAARSHGHSVELQAGQGAFYGPKLEYALADRYGRKWQCGTIQLDLSMPESFGLGYVANHGGRERPVLLHRAMLGSLERFLGIVLEHHGDALPAWLCPVQVVVAPVASEYVDAASKAVGLFANANLRVELDDRSETLGRRVRDAHLSGVPFFVVVGRREAADQSVTIRSHEGEQCLALDRAVPHLIDRCAPPM